MAEHAQHAHVREVEHSHCHSLLCVQPSSSTVRHTSPVPDQHYHLHPRLRGGTAPIAPLFCGHTTLSNRFPACSNFWLPPMPGCPCLNLHKPYPSLFFPLQMSFFSYIGYAQVIYSALPQGYLYYNRFRDVFPDAQGSAFLVTQHTFGIAAVDLPFMVLRNHTLASTTNPDDPNGLSEQVGAGHSMHGAARLLWHPR